MSRYRSLHFRDGSVMIHVPGFGWKVFSKVEKENLLAILKSLP